MKKMWYLNDLFVTESARNTGLAFKLLQYVQGYAKEHGGFSLKLATAVDNAAAKRLYENFGFSRVVGYDHYTQKL